MNSFRKRVTAIACAVVVALTPTLRAQSVELADTAGADAALNAVVRDLCGRRVVLLTEPSTHGFGNTIAFKGLVVRRLVDQCHYDVFMIESGVYDFVHIGRRLGSPESVTDSMVAAAIGGIWANADMRALIPFLLERAQHGRLTLAGIDDQLSRESWAQRELPRELVGALNPPDSERCLGVLEKHFLWQYTEAAPFDAAARTALLGCLATISAAEPQTTERGRAEKQMAENLRGSIAREFPNSTVNGPEANRLAFNARDSSMFVNFEWWLSRLGEGHKAIVWTATVHGAKDLSSVPGYERFVSMGSSIHRKFGDDAFVLGFSATRGSYRFVRQPERVLSAAPDSTLEGRVFSDGVGAVRYLDRAQIRRLGIISARPFGADFRNANWSDVLDGLIVFREERPPRQLDTTRQPH